MASQPWNMSFLSSSIAGLDFAICRRELRAEGGTCQSSEKQRDEDEETERGTETETDRETEK